MRREVFDGGSLVVRFPTVLSRSVSLFRFVGSVESVESVELYFTFPWSVGIRYQTHRTWCRASYDRNDGSRNHPYRIVLSYAED